MSNIDLNSLILHGKVKVTQEGDALCLTSQSSITSIAYNLVGNTYKRHYLEIPQRAKLPFSVSLQVKLDYYGFILLIGEGHVLFNCPSNRSIEDILKPTGKPFPAGQFNNRLALNKYVTVTANYCLHEMQILVDGEEAFYSTKQPYMKTVSTDDIQIGFEVAKLSSLCVRSIDLTALNPNEELNRPKPYCEQKPLVETSADNGGAFDSYLSRFTEEIKQEVITTDAYLKSLKTLQIKRSVDVCGNKLTYTAPKFGISYGIREANGESWQSFSFYIVTSGKAETWHRKADYMEETLQEINKTNPALAEKIFFALNECVGCYGNRCIVKTLYTFNGQKKLVCHGLVMLRLCREDFADVREFFRHLNALLERKERENTLQTSEIYLIKR